MDFSTVWTIWKREMRSYFYTPLAYFFIGAFITIMGFFYIIFLQSYVKATQGSMFGGGQTIPIDRLVEGFYSAMHVVLMWIIPFLTMRIYSEETRQNTIVLLMTSPVRTIELTLAKFFSGASIVGLMLLITFIFPAFIYYFSWSSPNAGLDTPVLLSTYLGVFLCSMIYIGIGAFWSSLTDSQIVAVLLTFVTNFSFWLLSGAERVGSSFWSKLAGHLSISEHLQTFTQGMPELKSVVYFLSLIFLANFLTYRSLESRSWR